MTANQQSCTSVLYEVANMSKTEKYKVHKDKVNDLLISRQKLTYSLDVDFSVIYNMLFFLHYIV